MVFLLHSQNVSHYDTKVSSKRIIPHRWSLAWSLDSPMGFLALDHRRPLGHKPSGRLLAYSVWRQCPQWFPGINSDYQTGWWFQTIWKITTEVNVVYTLSSQISWKKECFKPPISKLWFQIIYHGTGMFINLHVFAKTCLKQLLGDHFLRPSPVMSPHLAVLAVQQSMAPPLAAPKAKWFCPSLQQQRQKLEEIRTVKNCWVFVPIQFTHLLI